MQGLGRMARHGFLGLVAAGLVTVSAPAFAAPEPNDAPSTRLDKKIARKEAKLAEKTAKAIEAHIDAAVGWTDKELGRRMAAIPRPSNPNSLDVERMRAAEEPILKLQAARSAMRADLEAKVEADPEYFQTHEVGVLIDKSGNANKKSGIVAMLQKHDPELLASAVAAAKSSGQPVTVSYSVRLPEDIAHAAKGYVKLTGGGHPDALLHSIENPHYEPPHTFFAEGTDAAIEDHIDEITGTKAKDPSAKAVREKLAAEIRAENGGPYLKALWQKVVDYAHTDAGQHAVVRVGTSTSHPLAGRIQGAVHTYGVDTQVLRHATLQKLTNDRIEGVGATVAVVAALPVAGYGIGHIPVPLAQQAEKLVIFGGDDFLDAAFGTRVVTKTKGKVAGARFAASTIGKAGTVIGGAIAAGEFSYNAAKHYAAATGRHEFELAGRGVKAVFDGVAAAGLPIIAEREQAKEYAKSDRILIKEGKMPGVDLALHENPALQAEFAKLSPAAMKDLHDNPERLVEFVEKHGGVTLSAAQKNNLHANRLWAAKAPTDKELFEHSRGTMTETNHMTGAQRFGGKTGVASVGMVLGAVFSFAGHGHEDTFLMAEADHVASGLPLFVGAGRVLLDRRRPQRSMNKVVTKHVDRLSAQDQTPVMRNPSIPALKAATAAPSPSRESQGGGRIASLFGRR